MTTALEAGQVVISIGDTGCGIAPEIRDKIFDPFFTTKEVGEGTGQGLALARSVVVDKHGGTITFTSEVGQGTTFVVRLPLPVVPGAGPGAGAVVAESSGRRACGPSPRPSPASRARANRECQGGARVQSERR